MIKVLVADDEKAIREGIGRYIKGMQGFQLCGNYENGETAFAATEHHHPDLIISDVLMPKCDGIELIKRCREQNIKCEFIIISGYSEFEYAKAAIKYGVLDYINKPINPEILSKSMENAKQIIEDKKFVKKEMQFHFYNNVVEEKPHREQNSKRYINSVELVHRVFLLNFTNIMEDKVEFCEDILKIYLQEDYICYEKNGLVILIVVGNDAEFGSSERVLKNIVEKGKKWGYSIYAGIGDIVQNMKGIPISYKNALAALRHGQINQVKICCYELLSYQCGDSQKLYNKEYLNLERFVKERDARKIINYVQGIMENYKSRFPPYVYYDFLLKCCHDFQRDLKKSLNVKKEFENYSLQINTASDFEEATVIFERYVLQYCESMNSALATSKGGSFDEILEYIQMKYMEELSVEQICKIFYMNESYFSFLFKNKMGSNYNEYVTSLRINKSKELLKTGKYKINEVAEMIGYHSARYFSKVFKNKVGKLPQEYRNQYINRD